MTKKKRRVVRAWSTEDVKTLRALAEGEALGASGGEEIASDARRGSTEGDVARGEISFGQSKAALISIRTR